MDVEHQQSKDVLALLLVSKLTKELAVVKGLLYLRLCDKNRPKQQISAQTAASRLTACFTGSSSKTASKVSEGDLVTFHRLWQSSLRKTGYVRFSHGYVILEYHHLLFRQRWLTEIEYTLIQCSLNVFMCWNIWQWNKDKVEFIFNF